jgi:hypothetical protein
MKLLRLTLTLFQGAESFTLDTEGGSDINVFGDNKTGKTTLFNAYTWLLFDKDSAGRSNFEIKTIKDGKPMTNTGHTVEGLFLLKNHSTITLKKEYREVWTRKRGAQAAEFTGNETNCFIDGVKKAQGKYNEMVNSILPQGFAKILSDPLYFNEQMTWQERRAFLMQLSTTEGLNDTLAAQYPELAEIVELVTTSRHDINSIKTSLKAEQSKINEGLQTIPAQIAENQRIIAEAGDGNSSFLVEKAKQAATILQSLVDTKISILSGGMAATLNNEITELEGKLIAISNLHNQEVHDHGRKEKRDVDMARAALSQAMNAMDAQVEERNRLSKTVENIKDQFAIKEKAWAHWFPLTFSEEKCSSCGQLLPVEKNQELEAFFNTNKATMLENIEKDMHELKSAHVAALDALKTAEASIAECDNRQTVATNNLNDAEAKLSAMGALPLVSNRDDHKAISFRVSEVREKLKDVSSSTQAALDDIEQKRAAQQAEIDSINRKLSAIDAVSSAKTRVSELEREEKQMQIAFEALEKRISLIDKYVKHQAMALEEQVNSRFSLLKWKLFDVQINGGISPTCVCMVDGVTYPSLNSATKIHCGFEMIQVCSAVAGDTLPVWVDFAESVTTLPAIESQVIRLIVTPKSPLRYEIVAR